MSVFTGPGELSEVLTYVRFGFRHITALAAMDHILFLLVLAAVYRPRDWRPALVVVSAFTLGHSVTLALAVTGAVTLPTDAIEFLIPVTILATAIENLLGRQRAGGDAPPRYRPVFAGIFGLVHGAGFANYLRELFVDRIALPLLGFNVGIELGQLVVLAAAAVGFLLLDRAIGRFARGGRPAVRTRVVLVSTSVAAVASVWIAQRSPW